MIVVQGGELEERVPAGNTADAVVRRAVREERILNRVVSDSAGASQVL